MSTGIPETTAGTDPHGVPFREGRILLRDGRRLAWRVWGAPEAPAVVYLQGAAGCRLGRPPDLRGLRLVMFDRPGFGDSDRCPGRGLVLVADDLAELLDHFAIDAAPVVARSGGAPHGLAMAGVHPDRVASLTVISGACPVTDDERAGLVGANAGLGAVLRDGPVALAAYLEDLATVLLNGGTTEVVRDAVAADRDRRRRAGSERDLAVRREALKQGVGGWVDETLAITGEWDFALAEVSVRVDWYHGMLDNTVPISAARRLVAQLAGAQLHEIANRGHVIGAAPALDRLVRSTSA